MLVSEIADEVHRLLKAEIYCGVVADMLPFCNISKFIGTFRARTPRKLCEIKAMVNGYKEITARRRAFLKINQRPFCHSASAKKTTAWPAVGIAQAAEKMRQTVRRSRAISNAYRNRRPALGATSQPRIL